MGASAGTLTRIRRQYARTLPETATVQRSRPSTPDSAGGWSDVWSDVTTVAARLSAATSGSAAVVAGRIGEVDTWVITMPAGADVRTGDRVLLNGRTFGVRLVSGPRSDEIIRRVFVTETT